GRPEMALFRKMPSARPDPLPPPLAGARAGFTPAGRSGRPPRAVAPPAPRAGPGGAGAHGAPCRDPARWWFRSARGWRTPSRPPRMHGPVKELRHHETLPSEFPSGRPRVTPRAQPRPDTDG